jgi:hypothetical protein
MSPLRASIDLGPHAYFTIMQAQGATRVTLCDTLPSRRPPEAAPAHEDEHDRIRLRILGDAAGRVAGPTATVTTAFPASSEPSTGTRLT